MNNNSNSYGIPERPAWIGVRTFPAVRAALEEAARREGTTMSLVAHRILARACGFDLLGEPATAEPEPRETKG